ncbi:MAG: protein kinase [Planctomycetia bacterium]|nr:protein kinase [Planctomycetia bacterium]
MSLGATIGEVAWAECESVIRRFEDAWREHERPDISSHIPSDSPHAWRVLVELVHIDLEFRLRAGDFARTEDYLARFPVLLDPELMIDLLAAELALRNRHDPPAWPEEFYLRFPEHIAQLRARLPVEGGTGWFASTRPAERPGTPLSGPPIIAGYEIQGELGRGGMGVVYKARDLLLHRTVAVKTFATVPRPESCARFAREAEAIAQLDHPNIVPVYEVGEWHAPGGGPAVPFFVMKWYPGGSMDAAPAGPGTDTRAHAKAVETIARAVHHAHQRGVLHRDLKPSNILLDDAGRPHVADFGLAGRVDPDAPTLTAIIAGTPGYMAPEQARSPKHVSTAADVYGLGAILYHQLTGQAPFAAETPLATLDLVSTTPVARPSAVNPAVSRDLDTITLKCLEKEPSRRYTSAAELADDLERWRKGLPISARPTRAWEYAWRRVRRHPLVTALALTTLAALMGAIAVLAESNDRIQAKEKETRDAYLRECAMRYKLEETLQSEQATRRQLEETITREQRALYLDRIIHAGRLYAANQLPQAWELLAICPEQFRGWEWRYLDSLRRGKHIALTGHTVFVTRLAFLADGRLVSGDAHGFVRIWDVAREKGERSWMFSRYAIGALATHPKHNWVAIADINGVSVWNVDSGRTIAKLDGANWVAFTPDGRHAITADNTPVLRIWRVPHREPKAPQKVDDEQKPPTWASTGELHGHTGVVIAGVFTPDGKQLITSALDRTIRTWNLETGQQLSSRNVPIPVTGLALAWEEKVLAEAHFGSVHFTDLATGELRDKLEYPTGDRPVVGSSLDQRTIAVSGSNGEVVVWDVGKRRTTRVFRGHSGRIGGIAFGPDGQLAASGIDPMVRVWDSTTEPDVRTLAWVGDGVGGLAVSPDGTLVAVGPRTVGNLKVPNGLILDALTGRELDRVSAWPDIGFHPTSGRVVTSRPAGGAILWDPITRGEVWNKPFPEARDPGVVVAPSGRRLALSSNGTRLAIWDLRAGGIQLWNPTDGSTAGLIDTGNAYVHALDLSPDGSRLVVATSETVQMWDVDSRMRMQWGEGVQSASALVFSPNGQWVAVVGHDRTIRLRESATGREVRQFIGTALRVNVLCFSPDSTRLVTGGADRTARIWDVETGRELLSLPGLTESVTGLAWDAKNDRIYALDNAVRIWGTKAE